MINADAKKPDITTRSVDKNDLPILIQMVYKLAAYHGDQATLTQEQLGNDLFGKNRWIFALVAEIDKQVVGYSVICPLIRLQFGSRGAEIHHLYVEELYRRCGVGASLVIATQAQACELGCDFMTVGTHPDNTGAQEFYLSHGYTQRQSSFPKFRINLKP